MERQHTLPPLPTRLLLTLPLLISLWGCGGEPDLTETEYLQRAETAFDRGNLQAAAIDLKNALRLNPDGPATRLLLGRIYVEMANGEAAEKELRRAQSLGIPPEAVQYHLGKSLIIQRKNKELLDTVHPEVYTQARDYARIMSLRGQAHLQLGQPDGARQAFQDALNQDPENLDALLGLFRLALTKADSQRARRYLDQAIELAPQNSQVLVAQGEQAFRNRNYEAALDYYRQALTASSADPQSHLGAVRSLLALNRPHEALEMLKPLIEVSPNHLEVLYLQALAAYQQQDYRTALSHASRVISRVPDLHLPSLFISAASHYGLGEMEQALLLLQKLAAQAPRDSLVQQMLTTTYLALGQNEEVATNLLDKEQQDDATRALLVQVGTFLVRDGNIELGIRLLERAEEVAPETVSIETRTLLSLAKLQEGEQQAGMAELTRLAEENPTRMGPWTRLVAEQIRVGEFDAALSGVRLLQERFPNQPEGHLLEGLIHGIQKRPEAAQASFALALEREPGNADATLNLTAYAMASGDYDQVRRLLDAALELHPDHLPLSLRRAEVEARADQPQQAIERLKTLAKFHPRNWEPQVMLARYHLAAGEAQESLKTAEAALAAYPNQIDLLEIKGLAQLELGQLREAKATFEQLTTLYSGSIQAQLRRAAFHDRLAQWEEMEHSLNQALDLDPDHQRARLDRARSLLNQRKFQAAAQDLALLPAALTDDPDAAELRGRLALEDGQYGEAARQFAISLNVRPSAMVTILLAKALEHNDRSDLAQQALEQWLADRPDDLLVQIALGDLYQNLGQWQRAEAQYTRAMETGGHHIALLNNLAWVQLQQNKLAEARRLAEAALELDPANPMVTDTLAMILLKEGQPEQAQTLLRQLASQQPGLPVFQVHLAQALKQAGQEAQAREVLRTIRAEAPQFAATDPTMAELLRQLGQ